jgi:hypothetical protein
VQGETQSKLAKARHRECNAGMKEVDPIEILEKARRQRQRCQEEQQWLEALRKRATPQRLAGWLSLAGALALALGFLWQAVTIGDSPLTLSLPLLITCWVWLAGRQLNPDPRDRLLLRLAEKVLGEQEASPTSSPCSGTDGRRSGGGRR